MAAKEKRGSLEDPFSTEGKSNFFDQSTVEQMQTCYSCHPGGGPAEGIVQSDGSVVPYDELDPAVNATHSYDRDFYTYDSNTITRALYSWDTIEETIEGIGEPEPHDWKQSGVMEADCLLCHIDPETGKSLRAADGLLAKTFRPRMLIFADRQDGEVTEISFGMPLETGLDNESALPYTNGLQRMSRPSSLFTLAHLPKENVGEMMEMWTEGLKQIEKAGINLPYALYGTNVAKIWNEAGVKPSYCANPAGPEDEMARLNGAGASIDSMFNDFRSYLQEHGLMAESAGIDELKGMFFNSFIYGYRIKDNMGNLMPIPVPLRAYEPGKFYTDWDNPNASTRDYVRSGLIEGEGIPYSGMVGQAWGAVLYGMGRAMQGDNSYIDSQSGQVDVAGVMADMQEGVVSPEAVQPALHDFIPSFFDYMPTAGLMGLDLNGDGAPVTYVKMVKEEGTWKAKAYYNTADLNGDGSLDMGFLFGGDKDLDSYKWSQVCGQCHTMTKDHDNSEAIKARMYALGMGSDWVKNGQFINFTDNPEAPGYDVHMSDKDMGCGSCHLRKSGSIEDKHNFLKGTDTAHMVRNDLDNNPKPRTCAACHLGGADLNAPDPSVAHEEKFGENTGRHIAEISCQTCHIPYKRTWRFRAFDDTLGYYGNFDNRFGYNILPGGDGKAMAYPSEYALSPVYGTSPGYGIPHFNMVTQHIDADGLDTRPMDYVNEMVDYFRILASGDPGRIVNGMPTNLEFDFWKYMYRMNLEQAKANGVPLEYNPEYDNEMYPPLYYANGENGYPQVVIGNPITIMTWVNANPEQDHDMSAISYNGAKVLYLKEINAAIKAYLPPVALGRVSPGELAGIAPNDPNWAANPNVGRIILKNSGYVIFDHTGDMYPDIWWEEDVEAMQQALTRVLEAEGVKNPMPALFMAAHYFSDSHGVKPADKALGAESCNDCHGDYIKDKGAHRITDRVINFLPWAPPWFKDENRLLEYDEEKNAMVLANADGFFIVDGEVAYIEKIEANGMSMLGAEQRDILELSRHHAEHLFYLTSEGDMHGDQISLIDDMSELTAAERQTVYEKQVVNGPWLDNMHFYIPEGVKEGLVECGFVPSRETVYLADRGFASGHILKLDWHGDHSSADHEQTLFIRLPFSGSEPVVYRKGKDDLVFEHDYHADIAGYSGGYVVVKVHEPGEYVCVDGKSGSMGPSGHLWEAFMK